MVGMFATVSGGVARIVKLVELHHRSRRALVCSFAFVIFFIIRIQLHAAKPYEQQTSFLAEFNKSGETRPLTFR